MRSLSGDYPRMLIVRLPHCAHFARKCTLASLLLWQRMDFKHCMWFDTLNRRAGMCACLPMSREWGGMEGLKTTVSGICFVVMKCWLLQKTAKADVAVSQATWHVPFPPVFSTRWFASLLSNQGRVIPEVANRHRGAAASIGKQGLSLARHTGATNWTHLLGTSSNSAVEHSLGIETISHSILGICSSRLSSDKWCWKPTVLKNNKRTLKKVVYRLSDPLRFTV